MRLARRAYADGSLAVQALREREGGEESVRALPHGNHALLRARRDRVRPRGEHRLLDSGDDGASVAEVGAANVDAPDDQKAQLTASAETTARSLGLTAAYDANAYPISHELDGGVNSPQNPSSYTVDAAIRLKPASKEGHAFAGWYLDATHAQSANTVPLNHLGPITFYAAWGPQERPEEPPVTPDGTATGTSNGTSVGGAVERTTLANTGDPS